jgi:PucR C-terminal helix-turn-helix domain
VRLDDALRNVPRLDLTLVAGPWSARVVERIGLIADPERVADARRGELALLTRGASRRAAGRGLVALLELAGERELAAIALYGRATTSPAAIAAASRARVGLLAIGVGEDPALLAHALEAVLRSDPDAVLRRLVATLAAIDHAAPGGVEAVLIAASAELDAQISYHDGRVSADRDDTAVRIGCRLVADAIARAPATSEPAPGAGGDVILAERADGGEVDLVLIEALRVASVEGWRARRAGAAVELSGEGDAGVVAVRLMARVAAPVVCGIGADAGEARAALARAHTAGVVGVPLRFDAADPGGLVLEVAGSATARSSAAGLLAPLEALGDRRADTAIETLRVYLDCWGSLVRSGQILHLHPNAVAHRMKRVRALLPADLDDPDQRLALQIACRARRAAP